MTDSSGHLELDALADVLAGERDDAHLRSCRPCTDRLAELAAADAAVTAALGALRTPPLPDGLARRLTLALEEERRRGPTAVRPLRRRPQSRPPSWLSAAAAAAVLVLAGAVGWSVLDPSGPETAGTSAAGGGGQDTDSRAAAPEAAGGLDVPPATDWADEAARPVALSRLLAATDPPSSAVTTPSGDGLDRLRDPAALAACVAALPGGDDVLALDYATYAGAPAVAVVRPADPGLVEVTVVGSDCSAEDPAVLASVVLPRP